MVALFELFKQTKNRLAPAVNEAASYEADVILSEVLGQKRLLLPESFQPTTAQLQQIDHMVNRRLQGEPLQYIIGHWSFMGIELFVGKGVLIPRSDTEIVAMQAIDFVKNKCGKGEVTVLDLCSGTGAIAAAVSHYCENARVTAVELYKEAFEYMKKNLQNGEQIILADVFGFEKTLLDNAYDVIVSNPPYINQGLKGTLQKELTFEPKTALFAEQEGLCFYEYIAKQYKFALKEGGMLLFEIAYDAKAAVTEILNKNNYKNIAAFKDLNGQNRAIYGIKGVS